MYQQNTFSTGRYLMARYFTTDGIEVLHEEILQRFGPFIRIKRWLRGIYPNRGTITFGWSGAETIEEIDKFAPTNIMNIDLKQSDVQQNSY